MNREEYEQWKHHPLTELFHSFLRSYRKMLMEEWAQGTFSHPDPAQAAVKNLEAMCKCQVYDDLVNLDADFISNFYSQQRKGGSDVQPD